MDLEFVRGTRIMNYVTAILLSYFALLPPQILAPPPEECMDLLLTIVGLQFKALIEMGVVINERRLAGFFSSRGPDLRPTIGLLNRLDTQRRIFVTMEGSYERLQELVVIWANGLRVLKVDYVIGRARNLNYKEKMDKRFVHGLTSWPRQYLSRINMVETLWTAILRRNYILG